MKKALTSLILLLTSSPLLAQTQCMSLADTYYEQVYCQVKSEGKGQMLPSFTDFKRNDVQIQALLLKRDAKELGIDLPIPQRQSSASSQPTAATSPQTHATQSTSSQANAETTERSNCTLQANTIQCQGQQYQLQTNRSNQDISQSALSHSNKLGLPEFTGNFQDERSKHNYLVRSYEIYINKMLEIGLGGNTLSFSKFYYIFEQLQSQNISFAERFETMYHYLKKDKKTLAVDTYLSLPDDLAINDCDQLNTLWVCDTGTRNYVFQ